MAGPRFLDQALFAGLAGQAAANPRRRQHHNLHAMEEPCHRLLNALQPDTYVQPHCHRSPDKAERLFRQGFSPVIFDGVGPGPDVGAALAETSHVIVSIAPDEAGDPVLRQHRAELDAAQTLEWLCYYSTVGVYGDFGGAWIDESAPLAPRNQRSDFRLRFSAPEALWDGMMAAGLAVEHCYGDWDRSTFTPDAREIIIVARNAAVDAA